MEKRYQFDRCIAWHVITTALLISFLLAGCGPVASLSPTATVEPMPTLPPAPAPTPAATAAPAGNAEPAVQLEKVAELDLPGSFVTTLVFSPDGTLLVSGGYDNLVYVWGIPPR